MALEKGLIIPSATQSFVKLRDISTKDVGWRLESKLHKEIPEVEKLGIDSLNGLLKFSDGSSKYIKLDYLDVDETNLDVLELGETPEKNLKNNAELAAKIICGCVKKIGDIKPESIAHNALENGASFVVIGRELIENKEPIDLLNKYAEQHKNKNLWTK